MSVLTQLSDEQLSSAYAKMLKEEPISGDIQEALMNRINRLENTTKMLEACVNALYLQIYQKNR